MADGEKNVGESREIEGTLEEATMDLDASPEVSSKPGLSPARDAEEAKLLRRLQLMMNMVMGVIAQDHTLNYDDAAAMVADARNAALAMFPGKELAYDLIWKPRFQRLMRERFRLV